ncbi:MAG: hypothetical protein R2770_21100 [Acidimicrobiales bacterium]|nr:hypothetical protein [Acidimicrobiales bacterium]
MELAGRVRWDDGEPLVDGVVEIRGPQRRRVRHWEYTRSLHLLSTSRTDAGGCFVASIDAGPVDHLNVLVKTPRNGIVFVGRLSPARPGEAVHTIVVPREPEISRSA